MRTVPRYSREADAQALFIRWRMSAARLVPVAYGHVVLRLDARLCYYRYGYGFVFHTRWLSEPGLLRYTNMWGLRMAVTHQNWWLGQRSDYG